VVQTVQVEHLVPLEAVEQLDLAVQQVHLALVGPQVQQVLMVVQEPLAQVGQVDLVVQAVRQVPVEPQVLLDLVV
jgi:cellobiose-specific phosphotransferase system component IIB